MRCLVEYRLHSLHTLHIFNNQYWRVEDIAIRISEVFFIFLRGGEDIFISFLKNSITNKVLTKLYRGQHGTGNVETGNF